MRSREGWTCPPEQKIETLTKVVLLSPPPFDPEELRRTARIILPKVHVGLLDELCRLLLLTAVRTSRECYLASVKGTQQMDGQHQPRFLLDVQWIARAIETSTV